MDLKCTHASILGEKMSPFDRAVTEIFNFFFVELLMGHPIVFSSHEIANLNCHRPRPDEEKKFDLLKQHLLLHLVLPLI